MGSLEKDFIITSMDPPLSSRRKIVDSVQIENVADLKLGCICWIVLRKQVGFCLFSASEAWYRETCVPVDLSQVKNVLIAPA
ncbi:hypothetical protein EJB05_35766 [Eragrostis curvula]|uniref:Uncharacterized protein n=1 Tax=Eragrostis curvula TaxID=38414 RepID=A0A5J9U8E7_9POAL|nr:hypothetical protein EJB05_35766 [Eragrostis curvula]